MELWESAYDWLTICGNKVHKTFCREEISTHPDYPALTSLIDFLDGGGMTYNAVQTDASYINKLTYPLLAHIAIPGSGEMRLVQNADSWKEQKGTLQSWSGIAIQPGENTSWKNPQNSLFLQREQRRHLSMGFAALVTSALYGTSIYAIPDLYLNLFGLLSLVGLFISLLLVVTELGFSSHIIKQVCGSISRGGCERVLNGVYAKGYAGVSLADASLAYFGAQFALYLLSCLYPWLFQAVLPLAFAGVFISAASINIQARKIKTWCALCLGVVTILLLQNLLAFPLSYLMTFGYGLLVWPIVFAFILMIEIPIKALVRTARAQRVELVRFKKWKQDPKLFFYQWQNEVPIDNTIWTSDIVLGNPQAAFQITIACNPYCGPCAKAHVQLDKLLERYGDRLAVQMFFLAFGTEEEGNDYATAVGAILRKASTLNNRSDLQAMLSDWFHFMNYDTWNLKWQAPKDTPIREQLTMHANWIKQNNIQFTPTIFINGRKMPDRYSLDDIDVLLPDLLTMAGAD